jgi:hypothetical protein
MEGEKEGGRNIERERERESEKGVITFYTAYAVLKKPGKGSPTHKPYSR